MAPAPVAHSVPAMTSSGLKYLRSLVCSLANDSRSSIRRSSRHVTIAAHVPVIEGTIPWGGEGLAVGQYARNRRVFSSGEIYDFATIVGDHNPLHRPLDLDSRHLPVQLSDALNGHPLIKLDENGIAKEVVHGILLSSLFSCIFGTLIPGSVYLSQTLHFRRPVYAGEIVVGRVQILDIEKQRKLHGLILRCSTHVTKEGKECVQGEAEVWIRHGTKA